MWPTSSHVLRRLPDRPQNWGKLDSMKRLLALFILSAVFACAQTPPHSVTLTWNAPTTGEAPTGYVILRSQSTGTEIAVACVGVISPALTGITCVSGSTASTLTYVDPFQVANEGQKYFYVVETNATGGTSGPSNEVSEMIPFSVPNPPTGLAGAVK